jgi:hypothetical protein
MVFEVYLFINNAENKNIFKQIGLTQSQRYVRHSTRLDPPLRVSPSETLR